MPIFQILIAIGVFAILAAVIRLAIDVRAIRSELLPNLDATLRRQAGNVDPGAFGAARLTGGNHMGHNRQFLPGGYFVIWEWRDGGWNLATKDLPVGADPGAPPAYPGSYTGETVKTWVPGPRP